MAERGLGSPDPCKFLPDCIQFARAFEVYYKGLSAQTLQQSTTLAGVVVTLYLTFEKYCTGVLLLDKQVKILKTQLAVSGFLPVLITVHFE